MQQEAYLWLFCRMWGWSEKHAQCHLLLMVCQLQKRSCSLIPTISRGGCMLIICCPKWLDSRDQISILKFKQAQL